MARMEKSSASRLVVVVALLVGGLIHVGGAGVSAQTVPDVEVRDRLIADQEALLNVYRCMFGVDVEVVPGGCSSGAPSLPAKDPAPFSGDPTASDITVRDELVAAQEALLNTYRCRFQIDTQQVPGGCPEPTDQTDDGTVTEPESTGAVPEGNQYEYHTCVKHTKGWCQLADGSWRVKRPAYFGDHGGNVQVCGALEVLEPIGSWDDSLGCIPYKAPPGQLELFPHNCGPGGHASTDLNEHLERVFEPGMGSRGGCAPVQSWFYRPTVETVWSANGDGMHVICNDRDWTTIRNQPVCMHPDTDPSSLNQFQYIGLPDTPENRRVDRTNDPQVQKPYLNYDLVILEKFCERYSVAESCTRILGTQN